MSELQNSVEQVVSVGVGSSLVTGAALLVTKVDNKYLEIIFILLLQRIVVKNIIKKGFKTSIGWNLGKKIKSIHLWEPFTSIPIIGTKNREKKDIKKRIIEYLNNLSFLNEEKIKIIMIPIKT